MADNRTYNPLSEGYSGKQVRKEGSIQRGYTGTQSTTTSKPPQTVKPLQSGIIKPSTNNSTKK